MLSGDYQRLPNDNGAHGWGSSFGLTQTDFLAPCTVTFQFERMHRVYDFLRASHYPTIRVEHINAAGSDQLHDSVVISDEARTALMLVDADDEHLWSRLDRAGGVLDPCRLMEPSTDL